MRRCILFTLFLLSCTKCYENKYKNITEYDVNSNITTLNGFKIDTTNVLVDSIYLNRLDERLLDIETCMVSFGYPRIKRTCFEVFLAPIEYISKCSPWEEFLNVAAPQELCDEKGLEANTDCPCMWRTAIQDNNILIVPYANDPDDLNLWDTIRLHTGINNIWLTELKTCAKY
jgi:hypothetical protein